MNVKFHRPSNIASIFYILGVAIGHITPNINVPSYVLQIILGVSNFFVLLSLLMAKKVDKTEVFNESINPPNTPIDIPVTYQQIPFDNMGATIVASQGFQSQTTQSAEIKSNNII